VSQSKDPKKESWSACGKERCLDQALIRSVASQQEMDLFQQVFLFRMWHTIW
jgi:hypothetical protein